MSIIKAIFLLNFEIKHFQNHDVALKTNQELIRIFSWYNRSNDVSSMIAPLKRIPPNINWSFRYLDLFKNSEFIDFFVYRSKNIETRNTRLYNHQPPILHFAKSLAQVC